MKIIVTGADDQLGRAVVALPGEVSIAARPVHRYPAGRSTGVLAAGASRGEKHAETSSPPLSETTKGTEKA